MAIFVILPLCSFTKYDNFLKTCKILTNFEQHIKNSITELTQFYNRYSLTLDCISPRAFLVILPFVMIIIQQENTQDSACVSMFESSFFFIFSLLKGIVTCILDSRKTHCLFMGLEILVFVGLGII